MCASYEVELYMCFEICHVTLQRILPCIFVILVVARISMQTRVDDIADFRDLVISLRP